MEVGHKTEDTLAAQFADDFADAKQFSLISIGSGHDLVTARGVQFGSRRGETDRAGLDTFFNNGRHGGHVFRRCDFVFCATFTHHIGAHCAVWHLRADVDSAGKFLDGIKVFGETFPIPLYALMQRSTGNVLYVLHYSD